MASGMQQGTSREARTMTMLFIAVVLAIYAIVLVALYVRS